MNFKNINISFVTQIAPKGIADALSYAESEVEEGSVVTFILGDNFFGSNPLQGVNYDNFQGAKIFAVNVENPEEFTVGQILNVESFASGQLINITGKIKGISFCSSCISFKLKLSFD